MDTYDLQELYGTVEEDMIPEAFMDYESGLEADARAEARAIAAWDGVDETKPHYTESNYYAAPRRCTPRSDDSNFPF